MKQLNINQESKIEISIKQQKQKELEFIDKIIPHDGHVIWEINKETLEVSKAKFSNATYNLIGDNKKEIIVKQGFAYVSALTKKTALKKFKEGKNGSN